MKTIDLTSGSTYDPGIFDGIFLQKSKKQDLTPVSSDPGIFGIFL
jgi:hypothetical protein